MCKSYTEIAKTLTSHLLIFFLWPVKGHFFSKDKDERQPKAEKDLC